MTGLRLLLVEHGEVMARLGQKSKTATQMVAIILLFINNIPFSALHLPLDQIMLYACLIFTIYSGVDYFAKNKDVLKVRCKENQTLGLCQAFLVFMIEWTNRFLSRGTDESIKQIGSFCMLFFILVISTYK